MRAEAEAIVRRGEPEATLTETRSAFMRYRGQGHEIAVPLPAKTYRPEDAVELLVNGVKQVMRHLGMLRNRRPESGNRKEKKQTAAATIILTKFEWVYTKNAGMWYPEVAPGAEVKSGEEIGRVGDLFGDVLEKITSPVDGVVLFLTINPSVLENGLLMGIGCGG